jgi:YhcH/YjgK/YiaL family protein
MYSTNILFLGKYSYLKERFEKAFEFLKREDLANLPEGRILLDGEDVVANVQQYETSEASALKFEAHNRFFDIQYVVSGQEFIGMADRRELDVHTVYDEKSDTVFYRDSMLSGKILLSAGDFAVIAPEEAHKPRCAVGRCMPVKKIVLKVRI